MTYREVDGDSTTASPPNGELGFAKSGENIELYHSLRPVEGFLSCL